MRPAGNRVVASTQQNLARFKPARDRRVPVRTVACPTCQAEPDTRCVNPEGFHTQSMHSARRRAAIRAGL